MDNITHSLIGYTLAKCSSEKDPAFRNAAIATAIIGNNIPDLDSLFPFFMGYGNLGYLLYHRGFSHSVLFSIPLGLLAGFLGIRLFHVKLSQTRKLYLLGIFSVLLHIASDFTNNYGIHPFSPFLNTWLYGDSIFIVEPLIWLICLPLVYQSTQKNWLKIGVILLDNLLLALVWTRYFTPWPVALFLTVWGVAWAAWSYVSTIRPKGTDSRRALQAAGAVALVVFIFFIGSHQAKHSLHTQFGEATEVSLTPAPSNPFCWSFILTSLENPKTEKAAYVVRLGVLSLLPTWISPVHCHFGSSQDRSSILNPMTERAAGADLFWIGEYRKPWKEFESLYQSSCAFRDFLKFSRVPFWTQENGSWLAGDLRYQRGNSDSGFARIPVSPDQPCGPSHTSWTPPLQPLLKQLFSQGLRN